MTVSSPIHCVSNPCVSSSTPISEDLAQETKLNEKAVIVKCDMIGYFKDNSQSYFAITASVLFSDARSSEIGVSHIAHPLSETGIHC